MLALYLQAPFAVCRTFTAGWYRPTATFLTPSAAYGLLLNIAAIETRLREGDEGHDGRTPATLMRSGLPKLRMAIGAPAQKDCDAARRAVQAASTSAPADVDFDKAFPGVQTIYQQLHNYPVGTSGKERQASAMGNKYNITPVRREVLMRLKAVVCIDGNTDLEDRVRRGLAGEFNSTRYGIPFLGDNQYLVDRLEILDTLPSAFWYERIGEASGRSPRRRTTRMTIWIDRGDLSRTQSALFAPSENPSSTVPELAWTSIEPPQAEVSEPKVPQRRK